MFKQLMNFLQTVSLRTAHRLLESWKRILNPLQRPVEHFPVEEPQPVNRDVDGTGRVISLGVQMIQILPDLLITDQIRGPVIMPRQFRDDTDVALDRARRTSFEGENFNELLT